MAALAVYKNGMAFFGPEGVMLKASGQPGNISV
jgi:hypothetical protein